MTKNAESWILLLVKKSNIFNANWLDTNAQTDTTKYLLHKWSVKGISAQNQTLEPEKMRQIQVVVGAK